MRATAPAAEQVLEAARSLAPALRAASDEIDRERRLPEPLVEAFKQADLFRLSLPRELGGLALDPLTTTRIVEEISAANGSAGWVLTVALSCSFWASGGLPPAVAEEIFGADPQAVMVGAFPPTGRAQRVDGGYRVSGRWPFGSGCVHAGWFGSGCLIYDGDQPARDAQGQPMWSIFVTPARDVTIHDTWLSMGLRGTSSHDYSMTDIFVGEDWRFSLGAGAGRTDPRYGLLGLASASMSAVSLGIARAAIDAMTEQLQQAGARRGAGVPRDDPHVQAELGRAEAAVASARAYLYGAIEEIWTSLQAGTPLTLQQRAAYRLATVHAVQSSVEAVDRVRALAGSRVVFSDQSLDRCFRDVHTAEMHVTMHPPGPYATGGQFLLGIDPGRGLF